MLHIRTHHFQQLSSISLILLGKIPKYLEINIKLIPSETANESFWDFSRISDKIIRLENLAKVERILLLMIIFKGKQKYFIITEDKLAQFKDNYYLIMLINLCLTFWKCIISKFNRLSLNLTKSQQVTL